MTRAGEQVSGGAGPAPEPGEGGERLRPGNGLPAHRLVAWEEEHPGLRAGVTAGAEAGDLGVASRRPPAEWLEQVEAALWALGGRGIALPRQVHGGRVVEVCGRPTGVLVPGEADGLSTGETGTFLAVTVADCVPVFVLDPENRAVALLHAGWRGTAGGILETGLAAMEKRYGSRRSKLLVHLGPAICGSCYEVGPEVVRSLGRDANGKVRLDLRAELADRAAGRGIAAPNLTRSEACTRCGSDHFFSHRGTGTAKRMAAFLGWQAGGAGV